MPSTSVKFASLALVACAPSALATIFTTSPVASSSWTAGQQQTISWKDDGSSPSLSDFGPAKVSIYAGNVIQQTSLQTIANQVDVSTTSSIVFTPDASIGPNGNNYFIRFESLSLKDASNSAYPALAFSAKFTLSDMTGTFNSTVQSEIDGASTAGTVGGAAPATSSKASTSASHASTSSSAKASSTAGSDASSSGASKMGVSLLMGLVGVGAVVLAAL